ncbi:unnamed protein product [Rhizophagus irregularis]|uniref:Protein kinase domain-containing protein n=1 Tax=Rhizophagus irregularis TaxID=588596 RepID=A0A2N1MW04_9GLOM|nr:hypothetical protein RhiirC2_785634 [Rhizophagus irregularis]CAB5365597.1 unnamed protein product [Rhizophagus irregularis]
MSQMSQHAGSRKSFGKCFDCERQRPAVAWCENCDIAFLKENFRNWTSGNSKIDELIKYTQLNARESMDYLEWIDFDQFDLIENINKRGAFSSIYSAVWMDGPKWNLDEEAKIWTRTGPIKVILKRLDNSQNIDQEFVNQASKQTLLVRLEYIDNGTLASSKYDDNWETKWLF